MCPLYRVPVLNLIWMLMAFSKDKLMSPVIICFDMLPCIAWLCISLTVSFPDAE